MFGLAPVAIGREGYVVAVRRQSSSMGRFFVIRATPASLPSNPSMSATALNDRHDQPSGSEVHRTLREVERTLERLCLRLVFHAVFISASSHISITGISSTGRGTPRHAVANQGLGFGPNPQWKNHKMRGCFTLTRQDRRETGPVAGRG